MYTTVYHTDNIKLIHMKKLFKLFLTSGIGLALFACQQEALDPALSAKVDELAAQVSDLSKKVADLNLQVVAIKEVLNQLEAGGYIQYVDKSVAGQYTISFVDGKTVVLLDPASMPASYSVSSEGDIIISYGGVTTNLGELGGDCWFQDIEVGADKVVFTLQDDTQFEIPFAKAFKLVIENPEKEVSDGEVVNFPYTVQNANASTTVDAFASGSYEVKVEAEKVVVTVPTPATPGQVLVWAQNGEGLFSMVKLSFSPGASVTVVSATEDLTAIPGKAGEVEVALVSNVEIELETPAVDWVSAVLTKANYTLTLTVTENTGDSPREAELHLLRTDTKEVVQTIKLVQLSKTAEPTLKVKRVWGKYSTGDAAWNKYLSGFNQNADRNVTMDDNYIYIAEAKPGVKKIWALSKADGSFVKNLPTESVKDAGTFPLCCPRVMKLGDDYVLTVSNMTENALEDNLYLYVYENGTDAEPTAVQIKGATNGRLGDTFSYWGASATNSSDGKGLTKGLLYFDGSSNTGVSVVRVEWTKGNIPADRYVSSRYGFDNKNTAVGAFWTYPGNKDAGIWGGRSSADDPVQSAYGSVKSDAPNLWNASGDQTGNTECTVIENGYYNNVTAYQFFSFNGKRYIAYAKQVDGADGRLIILEGAESDEWPAIINAHQVVYQAAIQEEAEMQAEYNGSPLSSGHSGMDLNIRVVADGVDIVVLKQNVGLSLFKMSIE